MTTKELREAMSCARGKAELSESLEGISTWLIVANLYQMTAEICDRLDQIIEKREQG